MSKKLRISQIRHIISTIHHRYPNQTTELHYQTPFQLIVAVILSAQTTDRQVNTVTQTLFRKVLGPSDILKLGQKSLDHMISSIGLHHNKSKHIYSLASILSNPKRHHDTLNLCHHQDAHKMAHIYGYVIPDSIEKLISLPGVGIKTAKVVGSILYDLPVIAVDTHVHRVANRIGLVQTTQPLQTDRKLPQVIPADLIRLCHHSMILRGRYLCKAQKPLCHDCPLQSVCSRYGNHHHTKT